MHQVTSWLTTLVFWAPKMNIKVFIARDQFDAMVTAVLDNKLLRENHYGENVAIIYIKEANRSMIIALQAANIQ